jgi:hypothetical protein
MALLPKQPLLFRAILPPIRRRSVHLPIAHPTAWSRTLQSKVARLRHPRITSVTCPNLWPQISTIYTSTYSPRSQPSGSLVSVDHFSDREKPLSRFWKARSGVVRKERPYPSRHYQPGTMFNAMPYIEGSPCAHFSESFCTLRQTTIQSVRQHGHESESRNSKKNDLVFRVWVETGS